MKKRVAKKNALVPIPKHDGELLVPGNVVGSHSLVVGVNHWRKGRSRG